MFICTFLQNGWVYHIFKNISLHFQWQSWILGILKSGNLNMVYYINISKYQFASSSKMSKILYDTQMYPSLTHTIASLDYNIEKRFHIKVKSNVKTQNELKIFRIWRGYMLLNSSLKFYKLKNSIFQLNGSCAPSVFFERLERKVKFHRKKANDWRGGGPIVSGIAFVFSSIVTRYFRINKLFFSNSLYNILNIKYRWL